MFSEVGIIISAPLQASEDMLEASENLPIT